VGVIGPIVGRCRHPQREQEYEPRTQHRETAWKNRIAAGKAQVTRQMELKWTPPSVLGRQSHCKTIWQKIIGQCRRMILGEMRAAGPCGRRLLCGRSDPTARSTLATALRNRVARQRCRQRCRSQVVVFPKKCGISVAQREVLRAPSRPKKCSRTSGKTGNQRIVPRRNCDPSHPYQRSGTQDQTMLIGALGRNPA